MTDLLIRSGAAQPNGAVLSVTPESAGWSYVGFEVHRLGAGEGRAVRRAEREHCLVVLGGLVDVRAGAQSWPGIGGRADPLEGLPHAVYAPAGVPLEITAQGPGGAEVAIASAPGSGADGRSAALITPQDIEVEVRGRGAFERRIHPILMDDRPAESLLVVYTGQSHFSAGQNWQVVRRRLDGDAEAAALFEEIARVAGGLAPALTAGDLPGVGARMAEVAVKMDRTPASVAGLLQRGLRTLRKFLAE